MKKARSFTAYIAALALVAISVLNTSCQPSDRETEAAKKEDIQSALAEIRGTMHNRFFEKGRIGFIPNEESKKKILQKQFTIGYFQDEVAAIVDSALKTHGVQGKYQYMITNVSGELISGTRPSEDMHLQQADSIILSPENATFRETLHLYLAKNH